MRRLALDRLEPTPENFARAYAEEAGEDAVMLPTRARAPLERLLVRLEDDEATRRLLLDELQQGRWHRLDWRRRGNRGCLGFGHRGQRHTGRL